MPAGFRVSSDYTRRRRNAGLLYRGGPDEQSDLSHLPGIPLVGLLTGDPQANDWGGHTWSPWVPLAETALRGGIIGSGLYRMRGAERGLLLYIGQGRFPGRPLRHLAKTRIADHRQGRIFAAQARLECSWVLDGAWHPHQRLELENDLIAAHVLITGRVPSAQFLG